MRDRDPMVRPMWVSLLLVGVPDRPTARLMLHLALAAGILMPTAWLAMQPLGELRSWLAAGLVGVFVFACREVFRSAVRWMDAYGQWSN